MYKRQRDVYAASGALIAEETLTRDAIRSMPDEMQRRKRRCLLYTSDAADERSSVDLGGRRIIKKKTQEY